MAANYKHSGKRILTVATGTVVSGALVSQKGFVGIALVNAVNNGKLWVAIDGVWNLAVPASTVEGDLLYTTGANGTVADSVSLEAGLARAGSNANTPVVKAVTDRDASGKADCLILAQGARKAALQV